jgi:hypothetical protein
MHKHDNLTRHVRNFALWATALSKVIVAMARLIKIIADVLRGT